MPPSDDECPGVLEGRPAPDDPCPARPRGRRRTGARWTLAAGMAALVTGVVLAQGLLIATGLVLAGIGVQMFDARGVPGELPERPTD